MLLPRALTAVVGIPMLLYFIHAGGLAFSAFVMAVAVLCLYEYGMIMAMGGRPVQRIVVLLCGAALAACAALGADLGLVLASVVGLVMLREMAHKQHSLDRLTLTVFGALFLGWMPAHLALIRDLRPDGRTYAFLFFAAVWVMDTAAYAVGKAAGKHKLAANLSPKKTWEGAAAGFAAAILVALIFRQAALRETLTLSQAAVLGALIGVFGQLSDLAESLLKRAVGVKDSGSLLPGHGGVMDRFDSFILCSPAVYYYLKLVHRL